MLLPIPYNRIRAVEYAKKWALSRNPLFFDFTEIGGNCTNFVSQCIFAGAPIMNYTKTFGWYYFNQNDRAPAWSGVNELYNFLIGAPDFIANNGGYGPYATDARSASRIDLGDIIQLARNDGTFYHSLIITGFTDNDILVSAQSNDALDKPLTSYNYTSLRYIHIEAVRMEVTDDNCFSDLIEGISLNIPDELIR